MSGQSTSSLSALLKPNVKPALVDLLYRETDFINFMRSQGRIFDSVGSAPMLWNVITAVNASTEVFTEGQAPPQAGKQTYAQASILPFYFRGVFGKTGHVRDNEKKGGYYVAPSIGEAELAKSDVFKAGEDQLCGSTADRGFSTAIDSTGTYATLSASTTTVWASQEDGSIGVLGASAMNTLYTELTSASVSSVARGANPTHWLMPANQIQNYGAIVGPTATSGSLWRMNAGTGYDAGLPGSIPVGGSQLTSLTHMGLPIVRVRGITTTEAYLVDVTDMSLQIHRDMEVAPILGNTEIEQFQISMALYMIVEKRNKHGKLTGVTA